MAELPDLHQRLSVHPHSVELCRSILMEMAWRSGIDGAEGEIEALSDWEAVQRVERLWRGVIALGRAGQRLARSAAGAAAASSALGESLLPLAGEQLANETELFLAIDHS